jgi:hypothetical protein
MISRTDIYLSIRTFSDSGGQMNICPTLQKRYTGGFFLSCLLQAIGVIPAKAGISKASLRGPRREA